MHIPKKWKQLTRHYGYYSTRARGERNKAALTQQALTTSTVLPLTSTLDKPKASETWAALIKQVYEVDPLECPKCKSQMRILSFIIDVAEIKKITRSLNIPHFQKPAPPLGAPLKADSSNSELDLS